jgi:hypothetical protein
VLCVLSGSVGGLSPPPPPPLVARQRLGKSPLIVDRQQLGKNPHNLFCVL